MEFGPKNVRSVAVVSGGGTAEMGDTAKEGVDAFLTGEPSLSAYNAARDHGLNVLFAGHYATEIFGVRALADVLKKKFRLPAEFIDLGVGF
jgi:putative NIF3 family GTP cyclohydrolase 1 type 2